MGGGLVPKQQRRKIPGEERVGTARLSKMELRVATNAADVTAAARRKAFTVVSADSAGNEH